MNTITVWLLVTGAWMNGSTIGSAHRVEPFMFPTASACEQVLKNLITWSSGSVWARCVQTTVVKP